MGQCTHMVTVLGGEKWTFLEDFKVEERDEPRFLATFTPPPPRPQSRIQPLLFSSHLVSQQLSFAKFTSFRSFTRNFWPSTGF